MDFGILFKPYVEVIIPSPVADHQQSFAGKNSINERSVVVPKWLRVMNQLGGFAKAGDEGRRRDNLPGRVGVADASALDRLQCGLRVAVLYGDKLSGCITKSNTAM